MGTVTLACTWPNGLILRGYKRVKDGAEQTGFRTEPTGMSVQIPGPGADNPHFGSAVVDSTFWDDWCQHHKGSDVLDNGLLFVIERDDDAKAPKRMSVMQVAGDSRRP